MVDTNLSEAKASGNLKRKQDSIELVKEFDKISLKRKIRLFFEIEFCACFTDGARIRTLA